MVTCVAQQLSSEMSTNDYPRKLFRAATYDSIMLPSTTCRKRLLSEQNECHNSVIKLSNDDIYSNKKIRTESLSTDSDDNNNNSINQHHMLYISSLSSFENTTYCPLSPCDQRRKSFTDINNISCPASNIFPQLSTTNNEMLFCQQKSITDDNNHENEHKEKSNSSMFLTSAQVSAYMTSVINIQNGKLLIIDCGLLLRHNERRIKDSFLLNINDKLSRKRLVNRGLKNFLDQNQLNRLNQSEVIILYDDSISSSSSSCSNSTLPQQMSSVMKCIFDEIKRVDCNKTIHILQSSFDEFYQLYPTFCYLSSSNSNVNDHQSPSPTVDIESYEISEIIPGLYLGNARDAENLKILKDNNIQSIINISTTIPCYYQNERLFDYLQLSCNDSSQENLLQYFDSTLEYIHQKLLSNQNILVHCQGGVSRSPSFVIGYLMKYHSKTFDQAYLIVKSKREIINPNLNFLAQLTRYEQLIKSTMQ